jgi:hypothetical protein
VNPLHHYLEAPNSISVCAPVMSLYKSLSGGLPMPKTTQLFSRKTAGLKQQQLSQFVYIAIIEAEYDF